MTFRGLSLLAPALSFAAAPSLADPFKLGIA